MKKTGSRLLFITSTKLAGLMNKERWTLYNAARKQGHVIHILEEDGAFGYDLPALIADAERRHGKVTGVVFEEPVWTVKLGFRCTFSGARDVKLPKATFLTDYWLFWKETQRYVRRNGITAIIATHQAIYPFIRRRLPRIEHVLFIPFCVDATDFDFPIQKDIDILNTGVESPISPFRKRLNALLARTEGIGYENLEHPGKRNEKKGRISGKEYLKYLSRAHFSIATTTKYNLSVRKYHEMLCVATTPMGNQTGLPEHWLVRRNIVELFPSMSDKDILRRVRRAIAEKKRHYRAALALREEAFATYDAQVVVRRITAFMDSENVRVATALVDIREPPLHHPLVLKADAAIRLLARRLGLRYEGLS